MKRIAVGVCGLLVGLCGCRGDKPAADPGPPPVEWSAELQAVADGNTRFALDLYAKLRENEKGNVFFSPYSAHTALAMTATGAKGTTRDQMVKALHLPADEAKMLASGDLGRYYAHPRKDYELAVANALWGQKGFPWRAEWTGAMDTRFGAGFNEANFRQQPDAERQRINKWVEEKTRDKIKDLLLPPQITTDTTMVLTNAIYFKGNWATQFDAKKTHDARFHCADDSVVQVPMMYGDVKCGYAEHDGIKMVELPYKGGELSMVVILPKLPDGLPALEKQLTPDRLAKWLAGLRDRAQLGVLLPKFKIESRYELVGPLKALGMTDAFDEKRADFTGMAAQSPGRISSVTHKAFVDVNEEGTEAAAATAVVVSEPSAHPLPFNADHPFLFFIRDVKHGTILFMGRVTKP